MTASFRGVPVWWAGLGPASRLLARRLGTRPPPILVFSLPRSGSSWVGEILGSAPDALYLREPVTQGARGAGASVLESVDLDPFHLPALHRRLCELTFSALPAFPASVVSNPDQWSVFGRRARRLVVKEINPLLLEWILTEHRPRLVMLLRHPAAVASSYARLGWDSVVQRARLVRYLADLGLERWSRLLAAAPGEFWAAQGAFQGAPLRAVHDHLLGGAANRVVEYEILCARPVDTFRGLYDFAELRRDPSVQTMVEQRSTKGDPGDTSETARRSSAMIDVWRDTVTATDRSRLADAYRAFELPWYAAEHNWAAH